MAETLRSNAKRNRERILEVAFTALTASADASLNSIAKEAGVGIATLYRHFPTRENLILEVYRHEVQQLVGMAPTLLAEHPPLVALRRWMDRLAFYGMTKAGLADALSGAGTTHDQLNAETYGPVIGALSMLLEANEAAGTIHPGLDPDDVLLLLGFLWRIDPKSDWQARSAVMLDLVVAGLRAGGDGAIPGD